MIFSLFYNFTKPLFEVLLCYISNILTKALWYLEETRNRATLAIKKVNTSIWYFVLLTTLVIGPHDSPTQKQYTYLSFR